jgi:hypothetical protein
MADQQFVRSGPLMDVAVIRPGRRSWFTIVTAIKAVVEHELFTRMQEARLDHVTHKAFLSGGWPVIEQFPQYMAMNLLKIRYGRDGAGHGAALSDPQYPGGAESCRSLGQLGHGSGVDVPAMLHGTQALKPCA